RAVPAFLFPPAASDCPTAQPQREPYPFRPTKSAAAPRLQPSPSPPLLSGVRLPAPQPRLPASCARLRLSPVPLELGPVRPRPEPLPHPRAVWLRHRHRRAPSLPVPLPPPAPHLRPFALPPSSGLLPRSRWTSWRPPQWSPSFASAGKALPRAATAGWPWVESNSRTCRRRQYARCAPRCAPQTTPAESWG